MQKQDLSEDNPAFFMNPFQKTKPTTHFLHFTFRKN